MYKAVLKDLLRINQDSVVSQLSNQMLTRDEKRKRQRRFRQTTSAPQELDEANGLAKCLLCGTTMLGIWICLKYAFSLSLFLSEPRSLSRCHLFVHSSHAVCAMT